MATPITWRNVGSTISSSGIGSLMEGAQTSFDKGIGALDKVLEAHKTTQKANWDQGKVNNTDTMQDAVYGFKDAESLAQAQASGQFQEMMQGFGAQVDRSAIRDTLDSRGGVLQERSVANQGYLDHTTRVGQRELEAEMAQRAHQGDFKGAQELASKLQIDQADHLSYITGLRRGFDEDKRSDTRLGYEGQRVALSAQQTANSTAESQLRQEQMRNTLDSQVQTREFDAVVQGLRQTGIDQNLSTTQIQQATIEELTRLGASDAYIQQAVANTDQINSTYFSPAQADTAYFKQADEQFQRQWEREANLPFVTATRDTRSGVETSSAVIERARENGHLGMPGTFFEKEIDANNSIAAMANTGFSYRLKDGSYAQVKIDDNLLNGALYNRPPDYNRIMRGGMGTPFQLEQLMQSYLDSIGYEDQIERGSRFIEADNERYNRQMQFKYGNQLNQQ